MREHAEFMLEKEKIDALIEDGYAITAVQENLEGAFVQFSNGEKQAHLHIESADARKYFSFLLKKQKEEAAST
ncbi:hypothetical protein [Sinobaca sp. H24]|uniref:hypothetical protein n=1 Tax=Sinobaca sp. H24 TaxID=2923376 RepID=UPI002079D246|nr:hypothetical protein [Sinobaca sp. H24]